MVVNYDPLAVIRVDIHLLRFRYPETCQSLATTWHAGAEKIPVIACDNFFEAGGPGLNRTSTRMFDPMCRVTRNDTGMR